MSETTTAPGEQPVPENAPVQTTGEQPAVTDPATALNSIDQETLGNLLFGERQEAPAAEPETVPPTPPEAPDGEQPPAEHEKPDLRRIPMGGVPMSERQQMAEVARMIRSGEASSQVEALQKMGILQTAPAPAETAPPASEPAPAAPPATPVPSGRVAELEAAIEDLRAQRDQADDDFDKPEARRLTALIEDSVGLLAQARIEAVTQQASASSWHDSYLAAVDAMEAKHDWTTDPDSPLYEALNDKVTAAQARGDESLQDPNFIARFADQIAEKFGKPAKATPPPPPPAQSPRIVGGGVAPGHSEAHTFTETEAKALIAKASKEELAAALFG